MKNPMQRHLAPILAALAACLMGCASQPPHGVPTNTYSADQAGKRDAFLGDKDLAAKFVLMNIRTETRDGRLRVQFDLKNTTSADLPIEWAIKWSDQNGFVVDTNPNWRPVIVTGQGFQSIQATAPTMEAKIFQLELRKPTPIK